VRCEHCYLAEVSDDKIIIHEGDTRIDALREINMRFSASGLEEYALRNARYLPVMRFVLQDEAQPAFAPERYCFAQHRPRTSGRSCSWLAFHGSQPGDLVDTIPGIWIVEQCPAHEASQGASWNWLLS
jgi:hypothetical protein